MGTVLSFFHLPSWMVSIFMSKLKLWTRREKELKIFEELIDKKITAIDRKIADVRNMQRKTEDLLTEKSSVEKKRKKELSTIYEKMVPARAALAMTGMDQNLATVL